MLNKNSVHTILIKEKLSQPYGFPYLIKNLIQPKRKLSLPKQKSPSISTQSRHQKLSTSQRKVGRTISFKLIELKQRVTSSAWIVLDTDTNKTLGNQTGTQKQIASLTKIMTCIVALEMLQKYKLDLGMKIKINKASTALGGTSAGLVEDYWISVQDLIYGMMLPSGNDAASLVAEVFGFLSFYQKHNKAKNQMYEDIQSIDLSIFQNTDNFTNKFIKKMNRKAETLRMGDTKFFNSHGYNTNTNYSSAKDLSVLCKYCIENSNFITVMNKKQHSASLTSQIDKQQIVWRNTNKLLNHGWMGIKTGQTPSAGACLASYKDGVIIVVLNSSSSEARFDDTVKIFDNYRFWKKHGH